MRIVLDIRAIDHHVYDIQGDFISDWSTLYKWGFRGFYENIKNHLKTDQNIGICFEDEDGDKVPIESEDEYRAFLKFLQIAIGFAKVFVASESTLVGNSEGAVENSSKADVKSSRNCVKFTLDGMMAMNEDVFDMGLPPPIQPEPIYTFPSSSRNGLTIPGKSISKSKKNTGKNKLEEESSAEKSASRATARFVAGVEKNVDDVINKMTKKCTKKDKTQSGNSNPERDDEVPVWLKKYLAEFRENLLQDVNSIVKEQCFTNGSEKNGQVKPEESQEEDFEVNNAESSMKYSHRQLRNDNMLMKLEAIQKREKLLDDQMQKTKMRKMKIMEKVNANRNRAPLPKYPRRCAMIPMNVQILRGLELFHAQKDVRFDKVWTITNTGYLTWTDQTEFRLNYTVRELRPEKYAIPCPPLEPDQVGSLCIPFKAVGRPGSFESIWSFFHMGQQFGPLVFCRVTVEPEPENAKNEKNTEEASQKPDIKPGSDSISETDSDNDDSSDSIAVIDDENHDDETGFVVVPMPPCFFPDKPQDSAVNVVVKPSKKCDPSQDNGRDQAAETSNDYGMRGFIGKISKQYMKKMMKEKHSASGSDGQNMSGDDKTGAIGYSETKPIDMTELERSFSRANTVQSEEGEPSEYEKICNRLRVLNSGIGDTKDNTSEPLSEFHPNDSEWSDIQSWERDQEMNLIKLFEEGKDTEAWEKYHELKVMKLFGESVGRPTQYQVPAMVPEMAGHNFGLPQHPFNPVQARYPVPPMPFQAGFINPPIIPRPNIIVPPLAHPHPPMGAPVPPLPHFGAPPPPPPPPHHPVIFQQPQQVPPLPVPLDLANSIYFQPSPYGRMASSNMQDEDDAKSLNMAQKHSKFGQYYSMKGCSKPASANSSSSCDPVDLSNRPAKFENTDVSESSNAKIAKPNQSGDDQHDIIKLKFTKGSLSKMLVDKKLAKSKPPKVLVETKMEESIPERTIACEMDSSSPSPSTNVEVTEAVVPKDAEVIECLVAQYPENQPYVDILPESLVNGVISAVNTASSACASALNTLAQTRKQASQQTDKSVYDDPKFEESIAQLYEMGFYNYEKNCCLLKKYKFVVEDVVSHYCTNPNEI